MSVVKVSWSGGKDSTCSVFKHLELGNTVKAVCYIPMFTADIPLIRKCHYDFIQSTARRIISEGGVVHFAHGITFYDFFYHIKSKGKNKGKIMGFPLFHTGACQFKNYSKIKAINNVDVGYYDYSDIGIAFDEVERHNQLNSQLRSILVEQKITEAAAFSYCFSKNLISPLYSVEKRDGCAICPNAPKKCFNNWISEYPDARNIIIQMQHDALFAYPERTPRRNWGWHIDEYQISLFD